MGQKDLGTCVIMSEQDVTHLEINWSGFVRTCIESKAKQLVWKDEMLNKLKQEDEAGFTEWCIEMGNKVNKGISEKLKKEKLL